MRRVGSALLVAACLVACGPSARADDYFGSAHAAAGLTAGSPWDRIVATPRIFVQSPLIPFGGTFVTAPLVCARGDVLEFPARGPGDRVVATGSASRVQVLSVYRIPLGFRLNHAMTFLFHKTWEILPCASR
jgi:hypothetical protein